MPATQPYNGINAAQRATMQMALVGALDNDDYPAADRLANNIGQADAPHGDSVAAADFAHRAYVNAADDIRQPVATRNAQRDRTECRQAYALYRALHDVS